VIFFCYLSMVAVQKQSAMNNAFATIYSEGEGRSLSMVPEVDALMNNENLDEGTKAAVQKLVALQLEAQARAETLETALEVAAPEHFRRLQEEGVLTEEEVAAIVDEQLAMASTISIFFSSIFFMLMAFYIIYSQNETELSVVKRSSLRKRLDYCITVNLYICFFSCLFNTVQLGDQDDFRIGDLNHTLDLGRPIEWIMTCPLMQLCLPLLGGDKVPDSRTTTMPLTSLMILLCGLSSALVQLWIVKFLFYLMGGFLFLGLCYLINECIRDSTSNQESLLRGSSYIRALSLIVVSTWVPFPIWYALSPEGFNVITNSALMKVAVAFLNVISKGVFTLYLIRVRDDQRLREKVTAERVGLPGHNGEEAKDKKFGVSAHFVAMIQEALGVIGRSRDFEDIMKILDQNMITTPDDLMVLTPTYCEDIGLPWAVVFSFKDRWRRMQVNNADAWQLKERMLMQQEHAHAMRNYDPTMEFGPVSPAAPHVARNPEKLQKVLRGITHNMDDPRVMPEHGPDGFETGMVGLEHDRMSDSDTKTLALKPEGNGNGNVGEVVRDAEERLLARLDDMVNAKVMDVLHKNLKRQREQ
jgi:bacteriorhodopsin